jgi:hypothetical protein
MPISTPDPVEDLVETLPEVTDSLYEFRTATGRMSTTLDDTRRSTDRFENTIGSARGSLNRLDRMTIEQAQIVKDTSLNFLGLNIVTQDLKEYARGAGEALDSIEPPREAMDYLETSLNDFGASLWSTTKVINSASLMMGQTIDGMSSMVRDLPETVYSPGGFTGGATLPTTGTKGTTPTTTIPYGPGYPGYTPPSLMLYPAGDRPFNVTITAPSADGMAMANSFVNGLRAHGVEF